MRRQFLLLLAPFVLAAAPPAAGIDDLAWLGGFWVAEQGESWTEELWTEPRGDMLLGTNRSGKGTRGSGFEFMRIAADEKGAIAFWGSPGGAPAVAFPLVKAGPGEVLFENPAHDFPTRIGYRREGERLVATVSGPGGENPASWSFVRRHPDD